MCGRFTLAAPAGFRPRFDLDERVEVRQRFNVAPGDHVLSIVDRGEGPQPESLRWGLVPHWAKQPAELANKTINARSETVAEKPAYRDAFARKRCLILADGFFEWSAGTPHWITRADGEPFAFAGLWATWHAADPEIEPLRSCTILTTKATDALASLHHRMPVMLQREAEADWIAPATPAPRLLDLMRPFEDTAHRPVNRAVNDARHDAPDCLDPPEQSSLF